MELTGDAPPSTTTFYYDPVVDVHHKLPAAGALTTAYYAAPQQPDDARRLFEAACTSAGLDGDPSLPLRAGRGFASSLVLAREWEMGELEARLSAAIEASYQPTWDTATGEFTWGMGLDEPHPRGQFNAFLAAAEASGPGLWAKVSAEPVERCPQVVDVDFPAVAMGQAEWVDGVLHLNVAPLAADASATTAFRVVGLPGDSTWVADGQLASGTTIEGSGSEVAVTAPLVAGRLLLRPGH